MRLRFDGQYHLLIRTKRANLSKSMQWLGATYTKRFNLRHFRSGHLFQGRFKNMLVQNDAYLKYSKEEQRDWEDLRHGIFLGTKKFVQKIKRRYLPDIADREIPQQSQLSKNIDSEALLIQAAAILNCNLEHFRKTARISQSDIHDRDMLIYLMWHTGQLTNLQIAEKFGLTYSAVSRRVGVFKDLLRKSKTLQNKFNRFKSLIKI